MTAKLEKMTPCLDKSPRLLDALAAMASALPPLRCPPTPQLPHSPAAVIFHTGNALGPVFLSCPRSS